MRRRSCLLPLCLALLPAPAAQASAQLALEKGCYGCHGEPPRRGVRSLAELATDYARYRDQADAPRRLADQLRQGTVFGHIAAHERLSPQECEALMRWLIGGAK